MTKRALLRIRAYKRLLVRRILSLKGVAHQTQLKPLTAKDIGIYVRDIAPGLAFSNVARDIRMLTEPGERYDPEFDLLLRGQVLPEIIDRYSEDFLARLIKGVIAPTDLDKALEPLMRRRPDGRRVWEEV